MRLEVQKQIWGLSRTQAKQVTVRFDIIAAILGEDIANHLAVQRIGIAQTKKRPRVLAQGLEELENSPSDSFGLATFNRLDLVSCIKEALDEQGGIDAMFPEDSNTITVLKKVKASLPSKSKVSSPIPSPQKENEDE